MRRKIGMIILTCCVLVMLLAGCQGSKEKYTYRETGISQLDAGSYDEAIKSFNQALEHSDGLVGAFELDVLKYRAEAEYKAEDYAAAAHTYEILIQVDEPKPEYASMQNMLYIKAGDLDKALEAYQAAYGSAAGESSKDSKASKDSETSDTSGVPTAEETVLLTLGQALTEAERFDDARTLYRQAIDGGAQSSELYNRMGLCELEAGNLDGALGYFEQGMQIPGEDAAKAKLLYNQAAVYEQKQDFAKALELLTTYTAAYGSTPETEKEISFLKTRQ